MASQGPSNGTAADNGNGSPGGSFAGGTSNVAWTNVTNMDSNSAFATCSLITSQNTDVALVTTFGFSIPSGATIDGIVVTLNGKDSSSNHQGTTYVQLLKGGSATGTAKTITMPTTATNETFGTSTDLWGGTWAYSDINASNFGVGIQEQGVSGNDTLSIENVQIEVYYTGGSSGGSQTVVLVGPTGGLLFAPSGLGPLCAPFG